MDIRVLKKLAKWFAYGFGSIAVFLGAVYAGHKLFDAEPDAVAMLILLAIAIHILYGAAKIRVEMERNEEQRLIDKLARHNPEAKQ
jgi:hypothetical protein